jgi:hypothetical protein
VTRAQQNSDVEALKLEAASLRARAAELEAEQLQQYRLQQYELFKAFDIDGSDGVDARELQHGLKELMGIEINHDMASRLVKALDKNHKGFLLFEDFDTKSFEPTLGRFRAEDRAKELASIEEEKITQAKLEAERELKEYQEALPGNDDTGLPTRVLSVLAYFLPIVDASHYGMPVGILFPPLLPLLDSIYPAYQMMESIPFGSLIVFCLMQFIAANKELPSLLRFNLNQAIQLDILLSLPTIFQSLLGLLIQEENPMPNLWFLLTLVAFLAVVPCIVYSMGSSLLGVAPRSIPHVSTSAEKNMDVVRPDGKPKVVVPGDN